MQTKKIEVTVEGTAPLLMNKFTEGEKGSRKTKNYVPEEEAAKKEYRTPTGERFLPSTHFKAAMVKAGVDFKFSGKKSYKTYLQSGIFIEPAEIILDNQKPTIHEEPVVINRSRVMSYRPRFDKWGCSFIIEIIDDVISPAVLKEILEAAGKYKGVGDHRPEYGRFEVTEFKVIK